jgi:hypothetical protein
MLGRIDAVLTARQHRDRAGREACLVRGRVDPARQPRHHDKTRFAELARDHLREFEPGARGVARADRRHHRPRQRRRVAADRQKRRRIVDHLQPRRIVGLAPTKATPSLCAKASSRTASSRGQICTAPLAPPRCASDGSASSAARAPPKLIDQRAERARPDILAANEPQPIDPLLVGQPDALAADFIPFSITHLSPAAQAHPSPCRRKHTRNRKFARGVERPRLQKGRLDCTIRGGRQIGLGTLIRGMGLPWGRALSGSR